MGRARRTLPLRYLARDACVGFCTVHARTRARSGSGGSAGEPVHARTQAQIAPAAAMARTAAVPRGLGPPSRIRPHAHAATARARPRDAQTGARRLGPPPGRSASRRGAAHRSRRGPRRNLGVGAALGAVDAVCSRPRGTRTGPLGDAVGLRRRAGRPTAPRGPTLAVGDGGGAGASVLEIVGAVAECVRATIRRGDARWRHRLWSGGESSVGRA